MSLRRRTPRRTDSAELHLLAQFAHVDRDLHVESRKPHPDRERLDLLLDTWAVLRRHAPPPVIPGHQS